MESTVRSDELPVFGRIPAEARCKPVRDVEEGFLHGLGVENIRDDPPVFCGAPGFPGDTWGRVAEKREGRYGISYCQSKPWFPNQTVLS